VFSLEVSLLLLSKRKTMTVESRVVCEDGDDETDIQHRLSLHSLGEDVFQNIASYLDARDLSMVDSCCSITRRLGKPVWNRLKTNVKATSHAWVDLKENSAKDLSVLGYRAQRFAEYAEIQRGLIEEAEGSDAIRCSECGILPLVEVQTFRDPGAFHFFLRLSATCREPPNLVLWQGFSNPIEQGAWGESTILFFHLKEMNQTIEWTRSMKDAFNYGSRSCESIDTPQFQNRVRDAFNELSLTIVAFPREHCHSSPGLVVFSSGVSSVSRDNRMYYRVRSRHCRTESKGNESWVYPTLVTNRLTSSHDSAELLGIRVVCKGIV
jgi:hypothetical protein